MPVTTVEFMISPEGNQKKKESRTEVRGYSPNQVLGRGHSVYKGDGKTRSKR